MLKGRKLNVDPYKLSTTRTVRIPKLSGLQPGDLIYIEQLENGFILLIPEKVWKTREKNSEI
jgi:hypothetical protein